MSTTSTISTTDQEYATFEALIRSRVAAHTGPIFRTAIPEDALWSVYLNGIPEAHRQHYDCHACRSFVKRYGGLVTIGEDGRTTPLLWDAAAVPDLFATSVGELALSVRAARVVGVFLWNDRTWGQPRTGEWSHLHGVASYLSSIPRTQTAGQAMAEKREDYAILSRGLSEYPIDAVRQAVRVLEADAVTRSEKAAGVAAWLLDLQTRIAGKRGHERNNLVWLAVATAPVGFCHIRSTIISTLLDDIVEGLPFESIAKRWADKMHPLRYQRPTAPPREGAIQQAERLVAELGVAASLRRRFATLSDVLVKLWEPAPEPDAPPSGGVFDHLREADRVKKLNLPPTVITWEKFAARVLPDARTIEVKTPSRGAFYGLVTAADADAPAILQWDGLADQPRNPVSWYFYHNGSPASQWGLRAGAWTPVAAIFPSPHQWQAPEKFAHQGQNIFFAIRGAKVSRSAPLCLFPEILKSELHGIRSVVEAYSKTRFIEGEGDANGLAFQKGAPDALTLRVRTAQGMATYTLDRWE